MPLKIVARKGTAILYIRGTVRGAYIYESTGTDSRALAQEVCDKRQAELWSRSLYGAQSTATFAQAAESYLASEERTFTTKRAVKNLLLHFRNRKLSDIGQEALDGAYRSILGPDVKAATKVRHVRTPLMSVLEHAARRGWCARPNFERPIVAKTKTVFCTPAQIDALIENAAPHAKPLFTFLAGCGTRPSEAFELDWSCVDLAAGRCVVEQKQGNWRYIDLPPRVILELEGLPYRDGPVFRPLRKRTHDQDGNPLSLGYQTGERASGQAEKTFFTAALKAGWPGRWREWTDKHGAAKKQWVSDIPLYALRHTWATWHYCRFKDLRRTMEDGGWATIDMVVHYAKLMPDAYLPEIEAWLNATPAGATKSVQPVLKAANF